MIMALDIGFRRVGVALTDISEQIVYPYATLNNRGVQKLLPQVLVIVRLVGQLLERQQLQIIIVHLVKVH